MKNRLTKVLEILFIISSVLLFAVFMVLQFTRRDEFSPLNYQVAYLEDGATLLLEDGTSMPIQGDNGYFTYPDAKAGELVLLLWNFHRLRITICTLRYSVQNRILEYT